MNSKTAIIAGTALVVAGCASDVILTLAGKTVPSVIASILTAGLALLVPLTGSAGKS